MRGTPGLAAVLLITMTTATTHTFALSALGPFVTEDLDLSRTSFGLLTTVFYAVGALLATSGGRLSDALGGSRTMRATQVLGAAGLLGMALAPNYAVLLLAVAIGGLAGALVNPATNRLIADHVTPASQGTLMGIKQSGVQAGAFLSGIALPSAARAFGWQPALLMLLALPIAALLLPVPEAADRKPMRTGEPRVPLPRTVRLLWAYAFLMGGVVSASSTYLPLFAHEELGFPAATAGLLGALVGLVGVMARIGWGRAAGKEERIGPILLGIGLGGAVAASLLYLSVSVVPLVWVGVIAVGASSAAWNSVAMVAALKIGGVADAGRASGFVVLGFYLGYLTSPVLFGRLVDATDSYRPAWLVIAGVSLIAAATVSGIARRRSLTPA